MVYLLLVPTAEAMHKRLEDLLSSPGHDQHSWRVLCARNSAHASDLARSRPACSILLIEFERLDDGLRRQIRNFRQAAPGTPIVAIVAGRPFVSDEIIELQTLGFSGLADHNVMVDDVRLYDALLSATNVLISSQVVGKLGGRVSREQLAAVRRTLADLRWAGSRGMLEREEHHRPSHRRDKEARGSETVQVGGRLLHMLYLAWTMGVPIARTFHFADFPSADDARKLLLDYSGVRASQLAHGDNFDKAVAQITEVIASRAAPSRRTRVDNRASIARDAREPASDAQTSRSEIRDQRSEIRNQKSEIRNQKSEIRNQKLTFLRKVNRHTVHTGRPVAPRLPHPETRNATPFFRTAMRSVLPGDANAPPDGYGIRGPCGGHLHRVQARTDRFQIQLQSRRLPV